MVLKWWEIPQNKINKFGQVIELKKIKLSRLSLMPGFKWFNDLSALEHKSVSANSNSVFSIWLSI